METESITQNLDKDVTTAFNASLSLAMFYENIRTAANPEEYATHVTTIVKAMVKTAMAGQLNEYKKLFAEDEELSDNAAVTGLMNKMFPDLMNLPSPEEFGNQIETIIAEKMKTLDDMKAAAIKKTDGE